MKPELQIERILDRWMSDGPTEVPDRVINVVTDRIERQPQRPAWRFRTWRNTDMRRTLPAIAAVAVVVIVAVIGINLVNSSTPVGASPSPTSGTVASPTPTASPTTAASPSPTPAVLLQTGIILLDFTPYYGEDPGRLEQLDPSLRVVPLVLPALNADDEVEAPAWSPDGRTFAISHHARVDPGSSTARQTPSSISVHNADGTTSANLSADCAAPTCLAERDPAFSPDGKRIAFVRWDQTSSFLAIRDVATGETLAELRTTAHDQPGSDVHRPTWSPDGATLAFHVVDRDADGRPTASAVFLVGTDDTGLRRLTPPDLRAGDAAWSPDGLTILFDTLPYRDWLFMAVAPATHQLFAIAPDGTGMRRLDANGGASAPSWTANGRQILYSSFRTTSDGRLAVDIHVMDPDGSNDRTVAVPTGCCSGNAVQQPTP